RIGSKRGRRPARDLRLRRRRRRESAGRRAVPGRRVRGHRPRRPRNRRRDAGDPPPARRPQPHSTLRSLHRWPSIPSSLRLKPPTASRCVNCSMRTLTAPTAAKPKGKRRSSPTTLALPSTWTAKAASRRTSCKDAKRSRPDLNRYEATTHFNGQSTVTIEGNRATGESYTIAHHVCTEDGRASCRERV